MKQIQISEELFKYIVLYFVLGIRTDAVEDRIVEELQRKCAAMSRRQNYTAYRQASAPEERRLALDNYLHGSFSLDCY